MECPDIDFRHGMAALEPGVALHYVTAGAGERTVVLLHGFPETWQAWRHMIPLLVKAGYRVVAPDTEAPATPRAPSTATTSVPWHWMFGASSRRS